jgi:hypothetical protein
MPEDLVIVIETIVDVEGCLAAAAERWRMGGDPQRSDICRASAGPPGWCGPSGAGGAPSRCVSASVDRDLGASRRASRADS